MSIPDIQHRIIKLSQEGFVLCDIQKKIAKNECKSFVIDDYFLITETCELESEIYLSAIKIIRQIEQLNIKLIIQYLKYAGAKSGAVPGCSEFGVIQFPVKLNGSKQFFYFDVQIKSSKIILSTLVKK